MAFVLVYSGMGWGFVALCACFYLDEAQQLALPCDQVHIAGQMAGRPASGGHDIAFAKQMKECRVFALRACYQMRGGCFRAAAASQGIERGECALNECDTHTLGEHCILL